jgi:hypothetical protein
MYVLYYAAMFRCWHLIWILVRTNHRCLGVGCHIGAIGHATAPEPSSVGRRGLEPWYTWWHWSPP